MPINSWPVDQAAFTRITFVVCEPKMAMDRGPDGQMRSTGIQATNKDGTERKWTVQAVFSMPSRFDGGRTESEVKDVTITAAEDPSLGVGSGEIRFVGLTAGAMTPEKREGSDKISGGRIFLSATGVQSANGGKRGGES